MLAGEPSGPVAIPAAVSALAAGRSIRPVWENALGGFTFRLESGPYVKWVPIGCRAVVHHEAARMQWAIGYLPVPRLLDAGEDEGGAWLVTEAIDGRSVIDCDPRVGVVAIGEGLAAMHAVPVTACPFDWSTASRIAIASTIRQPAENWHPTHQHLSIDEALRIAADPPPLDGPAVVCHGDACAPNTLVAPNGRYCAHVDLGALGVGDRWADLAVATWSTEWNYGPGWEALLLEAYGIAPDIERTRYFRLLWDLGP